MKRDKCDKPSDPRTGQKYNGRSMFPSQSFCPSLSQDERRAPASGIVPPLINGRYTSSSQLERSLIAPNGKYLHFPAMVRAQCSEATFCLSDNSF
jgi:hypothetical protein